MDFMSVFFPALILGVVIIAVLVVVATVASAVSAAAVEDDEEDEQSAGRRSECNQTMGDYLSHKSMGKIFCPELVLKYAREYADVCRRKSLLEKRLEEAKKPEDLMD